MKKLLFAIIFCLTGCATRNVFLQDLSLAEYNSGLVKIYRTRTFYRSLDPEKPFVYIDEKELGTLGVGDFIHVRLAPGSYKISIKAPFLFQPSYEKKSILLTVKSGEKYYIRYSENASSIVPLSGSSVLTGSTAFDIVPAKTGEHGF